MDRRRVLAWLVAPHQDKKIRYRASELGALETGHLFCLASGNLGLDDLAQRFIEAEHAMVNASQRYPIGFWHVHAQGRIARMWP